MVPQWRSSADKHRVARADAIHAILNATYSAVLPDVRPEGQIRLFIGPRHAQALPDDEVEILVHEYPDQEREAVVFHVQPLSAKYRKYREEHPNS